MACLNKNATPNIIQLIHKADSDSVFKTTHDGRTPAHVLCQNLGIDEANFLGILQFLLREYRGALDISESQGYTPHHFACLNINPSLNMIKTLVYSSTSNETAASRVLLRATHEGDTPLHLLCINKAVDRANFLEILEFILGKCQAAACVCVNNLGALPLHCACFDKYDVNLDIIRSLVEAATDTVCQSMSNGETPLHLLNRNEGVAGEANEMIKFFLEQDPESARKVNRFGHLPLHHACFFQSRECCSTLISAYPDSVQIRDNDGTLPLHFACQNKSLEKVQYLHGLYPDAVNQPTEEGLYPINFVAKGLLVGEDCDAVSIVKYLLDCDPSVKLQKIQPRGGLDRFQLVWFCDQRNSNLDVGTTVEIVRALYDAYPQSIYDCKIYFINNIGIKEEVRAFIEGELVYAGQARDAGRFYLEIEKIGQLALQLHTALQNNASLGSIKLLVEANPFAVQMFDKKSSSSPLHVACRHHNSPSVVEYLLDLVPEFLQIQVNGNTILHLACQGAKCETIAMLLENTATNTSSLATITNNQGKLPIDLLFESSEVEDRESIEYIGTIFRLLQAYPETPWHSL